MTTLELKTYEIFKNKLGEAEASTIIEYLDQKTDQKINEKRDVLSTKEDIYKLETKLAENKSEMLKWMFIFWVGQLAALVAVVKLLVA